MKKLSIIGLIFFLGLVSASCKKDVKGYAIDDIVGQYAFSNADDAFEGLEAGPFCYLCDDADITITKKGESEVIFKISCPEEQFSYSFTGLPFQNENDSIIRMSDEGGYDKNPPNSCSMIANISKENGAIRLIGKAEFFSGMSGNEFDYYFDVLKD